MKPRKYIYPLFPGLAPQSIGNKAHSLLFLQKHKFRVPKTFIVSASAYDHYLEKGESVLEMLKNEISALPVLDYAVRSSTCAEDAEQHSFAGQFQTFTDVTGAGEILKSIIKVWESATSINKSEYRNQISYQDQPMKCAVILQEMVRSKLAGVSFSKNPVTHQNEVIVEAVEGLGEDLVQKGITPFRWRIKGKDILEGPEDHPHIGVVRKIARDTLTLKRHHGKHVDIEWAFDGQTLYYLQIRSIVGKDKLPVYSSKMAQEMLPGQIKPLVWSINIPLINGTWIGILTEITGKLVIRPENLTRSFYYRTYINMAELGEIFKEFGLPPDSLEYMMGDDSRKKPMIRPGLRVFKHTFRIIRFIYSKLRYERIYLKEYPDLQSRYASLAVKVKNNLTPASYRELYRELFEIGRRTAYLNIVMPLLMRLHNRRLANCFKKLNLSYDLLDFHRDFPDLDKFSPNSALERIRRDYDQLPGQVRERCNSYAALTACPEAGHILDGLQTLITDFGHLSDSGTDCSVAKWEENPEQVFNLMIRFSPRVRNQEMFTFDSLHYSKLRHPRLKRLYRKVGKFMVYREQISSLYIYGYGLFRPFFLNLGDTLVSGGILENREDIFYLEKREIDEMLPESGSGPMKSFKQVVADRKKEMKDSEDILLPAVIYGDEAPVLEKGSLKNYRGVSSSPGLYRGKTTIVRGTEDFHRVVRGDVLIIPFSDVSWTPILTLAGGIVSESGGMLSHCSIIARELGIPALVSVENACSLGNDLTVTIDGSNGILTVHEYE